VPSAAVARRRTSAYSARVAAKQRRQKVFLGVLIAGLAVLLAFELPPLLSRAGASNPAPVAAPSVAPTAHAAKPVYGGRGSGADPFAARSLPNGDPRIVAAGGPDPFTAPSALAASPTASPAPPQALPQQLVIGRPGGHRVATHGWIVILASIPTGSGRGSAVRFAREARRNVGRLSVLNSSNRRPLRGGYWVVYTGPYASLGSVSQRAGDVHAAGYRTAYIRELITYR
jgi:hypothetical protein